MSSARRIGYHLSSEQFAATELVANAVAAEQAGFDQVWVSDHFHPWQDNQGHASHAWVILSAIGRATSRIPMGTCVTCPTYRYRPADVAHAFATLANLYGGRVFLGLGSGESLNEIPSGGGWGPLRERTERLAESVELIRKLWGGEWVNHEGPNYPLQGAKLYDIPSMPVPIYIAASGPKNARLVGRIGDGWVTVGAAVLDPAIQGAFREGAREAGKDPDAMPVMVEHYLVVGGKAEAEEAAHRWRFIATAWDLLNEPDPREIQRSAEASTSLEEVHGRWTVSEDPEEHAAAIEAYFQAGVTDVFVHSGQEDQARVIDFFGKRVLPLIRREGTSIAQVAAPGAEA
ncbi:MAG: TIGR03557 family F420-dependent LLM class oxidoreductase [Candidatus Limnocylindrales bacterium]